MTGYVETNRQLDRIEPDTPPSQRYSRLVHVGRGRVLELRDPNEGQGGGPDGKTRHQYVRAGGVLWTRHLPPADVGETWTDAGEPRWEPIAPRSELLRAYYTEAPDLPVAVLRRQPWQGAERELWFTIRGEDRRASELRDVRVAYGPVLTAWWEVPLPPCPDCGGDVVWWEAGYVPGTRRCVGQPVARHEDGRPVYEPERGCGSLFTIDSEGQPCAD